jgi:hypothetical protein
MQPRLTGFFQLAISNAGAIARAIELSPVSSLPAAGAFDLASLTPSSRR